jgi:hypothetical protein
LSSDERAWSLLSLLEIFDRHGVRDAAVEQTRKRLAIVGAIVLDLQQIVSGCA